MKLRMMSVSPSVPTHYGIVTEGTH